MRCCPSFHLSQCVALGISGGKRNIRAIRSGEGTIEANGCCSTAGECDMNSALRRVRKRNTMRTKGWYKEPA